MTGLDSRSRILSKKLVIISFAFVSFAVNAFGQSSASARTWSYEVVSVKPSKPGCMGVSYNSPPGQLSARCVTVWSLMYNAYDIHASHYPPGLPGWADSAVFDVDAKLDAETAAALAKLNRDEQGRQRQLMLQSLLANRFKLRVHKESRVQSVYSLAIAKGGPKLKAWPADVKTRGASWGRSQIRLQGWTTERLAFILADSLDHPVVDKTGLTGNYDIDLKWTPDEQQGTPDAGPTIFTAFQEQLGLKLVSDKAPVETFVVDHVERPSEN